MLIIGIDPDTDKSGVSEVNNGVVTALKNKPFFELLEYIMEMIEQGAVFALEDVEINKPTFNREGTNARANTRISQNVGAVKQTARYIKQWLELNNANFHMIRPLAGSAKTCKKNAEYFNKYTNWKGPSNADQRDAAMLALNLHSRLVRTGRA